MVQTARPDADISNGGGWIPLGGGDLYVEVDEAVSAHDSNTTRLQTPAGPTGGCNCVLRLSDVTDPVSSTGHVLRIAVQNLATPSQMDYSILLKQGASTRATWTFSWTSSSYGSPTDYTLSGAEADSITDYTDLTLDITCTQVSGSNTRGRISAIEFEVPDAGAAATSLAHVRGRRTRHLLRR